MSTTNPKSNQGPSRQPATPNTDLSLIESLATNSPNPSQLPSFRHKIHAEPAFRHLLLERYAKYTLEDPAKAVRLHSAMGSLMGGPLHTEVVLGWFGLAAEGESAVGTTPGRGGGRGATPSAEVALRLGPQLRAGLVAQSGVNTALGGRTGGRDDRGPGGARRGQAMNSKVASRRQPSLPAPSADARLIEVVANNEATPAQIRSFERKVQNDALFQNMVLDRIRRYYATSSWTEALTIRTVMTQHWVETMLRHFPVGQGEGGRDQVAEIPAPGSGRAASSSGPPARTPHAAAASQAAQASSGRSVRSLSELLKLSKPSR